MASALQRGEIRPDRGETGINSARAFSQVYDYGPHAVDYMTMWDVLGPKGRYYDMGLDHFILTPDGDFDRVEFRIRGDTLDELPGGDA